MRIIHYIVFALATISIVTLFSGACSLVLLQRQGYKLLSVQSNSMAPLFKKGDAIVVRHVSAEDIQAADVISYRSPANAKVIVSHRVVRVDRVTGKFITKGDNIGLSDLPFPAQNIIGRVVKIVPYFGYGIDWVHQPSGLIILLYTPAAFLLVNEMRRLARTYQKPSYILYSK